MRISKTVTSRLIYCDILSQNLANRRNWINRKGEVCLQILEEGRPMSASQCCAAHTPGHCCRGRYGRHRHRENQLVMDAIRVTCSLDRSGHRSCCRRRLGFGVILPEIAILPEYTVLDAGDRFPRPSPIPKWHSLQRRRRARPAAGLRSLWLSSVAPRSRMGV